MGNLAVTNTIYATQAKTGGAKQTGDKHSIPVDTIQGPIIFKESKEPGKPDTIYNTTYIILEKPDTVYIKMPEEKPDTIKVSKEEQERIERVKKESHEIVSDMYKAIDGLGTDNKLFEEVLQKIDLENIYEVVNLWNETAGREYNESFIESFLGDANTEQRQVYGEKLIRSLRDRLMIEGKLTSDCDKLVEKFNKSNSAKLFPAKGAMADTFNELFTYLYFVQNNKLGQVKYQ